MNQGSDLSPPAEKSFLKAPPSPPLSLPPLGILSPDFDSRVDIYFAGSLSFDYWAGIKEGHYNFCGFHESDKILTADCALVRVRGPLRHQASTKITFRDGVSGASVYDGPLAREIDLLAGNDAILCLLEKVRAVLQIEPRLDLREIAAPEVESC
jgi:hypothetical protein